MTLVEFSYSKAEYYRVLSEMFNAASQAIDDFQKRNGKDLGASGYCVVVIDDPRAARDLAHFGPFSETAYSGVCHYASCGNWQSLHGAEYVAGAMVEALIFNGIAAHLESRMD